MVNCQRLPVQFVLPLVEANFGPHFWVQFVFTDAQEEEFDEGEDHEGCFPHATFIRFMRGKLPKDSYSCAVDGWQLIPRGDTDVGQNLTAGMSHNDKIVYAPQRVAPNPVCI